MSIHPHITSISIFDATKVVVKEFDTTKDRNGGSHGVKLTIHGDEGAVTEITVWRGSGDRTTAPDLVVGDNNNNHHESDGESDP